jgi:Restriction endonuclease
MSIYEKIFYLIIITIVIKTLGLVVINFINSYIAKNNLNKLKYGLVSRKDLAQVTNASFIRLCTPIIESIGIYDINIINSNFANNYQAQGYINNKACYIKFVKLDHDDAIDGDEDSFCMVGRPELQKFVGTMEHDNIKIGYVITNGNFSCDAIDYAKSMPNNYYIKTIDGCELTRIHRRNQKQYLTANLD